MCRSVVEREGGQAASVNNTDYVTLATSMEEVLVAHVLGSQHSNSGTPRKCGAWDAFSSRASPAPPMLIGTERLMRAVMAASALFSGAFMGAPQIQGQQDGSDARTVRAIRNTTLS